jgi:dephospho-CoA kinase
MQLVGICGEIGSGKTLVSDYLVNELKYDEYAFAKPLKDIAMAMGFTHTEVWGTQAQKLSKNKYWGISAREFLQKFGTEIGRELMPGIIPNMDMGESGSPWIKLFEIYWKSLIERKGTSATLVVSDVRFVDEAKIVKQNSGVVIRLVRQKKDSSGAEHKHTSETNMNGIKPDYSVTNDGTKDELYKKIIEILQKELYK